MAAWHMRKVPVRFTSRIFCQSSRRDLVAVLEAEDAGRVHDACRGRAVLEGGGHGRRGEGRVADVADEGGDGLRAAGVLRCRGQALLGDVGGQRPWPPSSTRRWTVARPMPDPAPVTSTTRPSYRCMRRRLERVLVLSARWDHGVAGEAERRRAARWSGRAARR